MDLAWISLAALLIVMVVSCTSTVNAGLLAIMVAHGALAGAMSPLAPTGIIADRLMARDLELSGFEVRLYLYNLAANAAVGIAGYFLFGGWRLFGRKANGVGSLLPDQIQPEAETTSAKDSRPLPPSKSADAWNWQPTATAL